MLSTALNKARCPTGQGGKRYWGSFSISLVLWPVNCVSKGPLPIFFYLGHWRNFVLKSTRKENKGPNCNAETFQNYFQLLHQVIVSYLQVEDTMIQHISVTSQEIYMNHGLNHIQNVFVKYLPHQVELRSRSLGKRDSETGSNLGHLPAKNIWTRSLWLLLQIPVEKLQRYSLSGDEAADPCSALYFLQIRNESLLGILWGSHARNARGLKLHMYAEFLPSSSYVAPWPSSGSKLDRTDLPSKLSPEAKSLRN